MVKEQHEKCDGTYVYQRNESPMYFLPIRIQLLSFSFENTNITVIHWIVIYAVDSVICPLNKWAVLSSFFFFFFLNWKFDLEITSVLQANLCIQDLMPILLSNSTSDG